MGFRTATDAVEWRKSLTPNRTRAFEPVAILTQLSLNLIFLIPFYLHSLPEQSANCVKTYTKAFHSMVLHPVACVTRFTVNAVQRNNFLCVYLYSFYYCCHSMYRNRACHSNTHVRLMLSSPNACLIITRVSVALFRDLHKI
jgi:hypothetical protein